MPTTTAILGLPSPTPLEAANGPLAFAALADRIEALYANGKLGNQPGDLKPSGRITAPTGWLLADGASLLRSDYPDLFSAIGTAYGAVDGTHFNVPDLRGRTPIGVDSTSGGTTRVRGQKGGAETHTLTGAQIPSHSHQITPGYIEDSGASGHDRLLLASDGQSGQPISSWSTGSAGGGGAHNNMQPFTVVTWLVKT